MRTLPFLLLALVIQACEDDGSGCCIDGGVRAVVEVGAVRGGNAMNVRGVWQVGQTRGKTS